jgi:GT2 family glycosyltransferase
MVSIIIPAYRLVKKINPRYFYKKRFMLQDTISSIIKNVKCEYELIVVVNGTDDNRLVDHIKIDKHIHKYALLSSNVGVPRAWNVGAHLAEGECLCFCNDDVDVGLGSMEKLVEVLNSSDTLGEVGPAGGKWGKTGSGKRVGLDKIEEADEISGYFFIIKKNVYEEVGGFDNAYTPAGCEEIDMSFKIRKLGYRCLVVPNTGIIHHGYHGVSAKSTVIKYFEKQIDPKELDKINKLYFVNKWYPEFSKKL